MLRCGLYPSQKHLAWLLCSGIINGCLAAARGNSAFGLQVRVISRQYTNTNTNTTRSGGRSVGYDTL